METTAAQKCPHKTVREYFDDTYRFTGSGTVLEITPTDKPEVFEVILDKTIFHPQGGGQPNDKGTMASETGVKFVISEAKHKDDAILHIGKFEEAEGAKFEVGNTVNLEIDGEFRSINARIHSAGHLLDMAMMRAGRKDLKPGKGYHFQEGPYVEYVGVVAEPDR
jgi:Ser-tRNA(Ala) deacylase AlaX